MKLTKINKNFQLIASTKNNLKIPEEQIVQGIYLQRQLVILCCWTKDKKICKVYFPSASYVCLSKIQVVLYLSQYDIRNKNQHCRS